MLIRMSPLQSLLCCSIAVLAACSSEATEGPREMPLPTGGTGSIAGMTAAPIAGQSAQMMPPPAPVATGGIGGSEPMQPEPVAGSELLFCKVKSTLDARCIACHDGMGTASAPMALKTFADLQAPAISDATKKVYELVGVRVHDTVRPMPPQGPLTAEQLSEIDAWVAAGAPSPADPSCPGNEPVGPTEPAWPTNCDETYTIMAASAGSKNRVSAGTETHPQIPVSAPWGFEEVQAIAWRAITDNKKVLHHWILYGPSREFIFGWAPGKDTNEALPSDVGVYLPSGSMTLDVHYNNVTGTQMEEDASGVEICVLKQPNFRPKTATVTQRLSQYLISVPAGAVDHKITGTCRHVGEPVRLLSASPHAHRTANHMRFVVEKANCETIVMHDEAFNFEEQTTYAMTPPVVIESGDRVITECTFSNDTDRTITFGENTGNEMCFNFALYEPMGGLNCSLF